MTKQEQIKKITITGILMTMIVILAFLPIKTLGLEITLTIIPIAIGGIIGGVMVGTILGFTFKNTIISRFMNNNFSQTYS